MASATLQPSPTIAVVDSGLGGLSVVRALRGMAPGLPLVYVADTAGFPYGSRSPENINARARLLIATLAHTHAPSHVILACNTLSTLCLAELRSSFPAIAFIGTVPAIKVAAAQSVTHRFTLLATPNTAHSAYSQDLIDRFAQGCVVDSYGAPNLAAIAEAALLGDAVDEAAVRRELEPCFHDDDAGKTDHIILGCTHYPLVLGMLKQQAPWPVQWVDSSAAIARHALTHYTGPREGESIAHVTAIADVERYERLFDREGFASTAALPIAAATRPPEVS